VLEALSAPPAALPRTNYARSTAPPFAVAAFFALSVLELLGTTPFAVVSLDVAPRSSGSPLEAALYLVTTTLCLAAAAGRFGSPLALRLPLPIVLLLAYAGVSLLWSAVPGIALPRCLQFALVTCTAFGFAQAFGARLVIGVLTVALGVAVLLDLAAVALVAGAVHRPVNSPEMLAGAWRGLLHLHKNGAGPVAALAALVLAIRFVHRPRWLTAALLAAAILLLIGTQSRTAQVLLAACLGFAVVYRAILIRLSAVGRLAVAGFAALLLGLLFGSMLLAYLTDPAALTGRVGLWEALGRYLAGNWIAGSGYGSFWRLGTQAPILGLTDGWATRTGQAHNGYLDALLSLGIVGFGLTLWAFVAQPARDLLRLRPPLDEATLLAATLFAFCALHNLVESSVLIGNQPIHFVLALSIAVLHRAVRPGAG